MKRAADDHADRGDDEHGGPHGPRVMLECAAEHIAADAEDRGPDDPARRIEEKERLPIVAIDAGEERREGAQHRDEAAEKHDLPAVLEEEILPDLEPPLVQANVVSVAVDERKAEFAADPIAAIVAEDRARRRRRDHPIDVQRSMGGEDRGGDQNGLAGHRNPGALHRDDQEDREIAVGRDEMLQMRHKLHVKARPWLRSDGAHWRALCAAQARRRPRRWR